MGVKFADYMREVEAASTPEERAALDAFRERYELAHQVLLLRREQNLTQVALAERTGIAQSEISRIECGSANPTASTLQALARGLGAHVALVRDAAPASA